MLVVLPAPLRPTSPIRSPLPTRRVSGSSRMRAPARNSRSVAVIMQNSSAMGRRVVWRDPDC